MIVKIAFVGTCQVHGMAATARQLLPDAEIESFHLNAPHDRAEIERRLQDFDFGVSQFRNVPGPDDQSSPLSWADMTSTMRGAVFVPPPVFQGFHPDTVYLSDTAGLIFGPHSDYHSQLAVLGYISGLSIERTLALFNAHVFAEMGYFQSYDLGKDRLLREFAGDGYDLSAIFEEWQADGLIFMHTINHPKVIVLSELTKLVLARLELIDPQTPTPDDVEDYLGNSIAIPVYPPLAKRLNVEGSSMILRSRFEVGPDADRALALRDYIARSFDIYQARDPEVWHAAVAPPALARFRELLT